MQASWRGENVNSGGLTVAPYSNNSFTHSRLPAAQASHSGVLPSMLRASTCRAQSRKKVKYTPVSQSCTDEESHQLGLSLQWSISVAALTPSHLCTSVQQQSDALGLSLYTRLMQGGDGVDCHDVNRCTSLDQLLQLEGPALCSGLVHGWPVRPKSKTMSCKYVKSNKTEAFYSWSVDLW